MLKEALLVLALTLAALLSVSSGFEYDPAVFRLAKKAEALGPEKRQALQKILLRYGKRAEAGTRHRRDFRNCFFSPVQCYMREGALARRRK